MLALLSLLLWTSPAMADSSLTPGALWDELFTPAEQRVLHAMSADPQVGDSLRAGLSRVLEAQGSMASEMEKRRFQLEWISKVSDFGARYRQGDAALLQRMAGLPKMEASQVAEQLPWFAEEDKKSWGSRLIPGTVAQLNAHELSYSVASFRSATPAEQKKVLGKLGTARAFGYKPEDVVGELMKTARKGLSGDIESLQGQQASRSRSVKEQLEKLASLGNAPAMGVKFDGGTGTGSSPDPVSVGQAGPAASKDKPAAALARSQGGPSLKVQDLPLPKAAAASSSGGGSGSGLGSLLGLLLVPFKVLATLVAGLFGVLAAKA